MKAVAIFDVVPYWDGDTPRTATRGETIDLSTAEFNRLSDAKVHPPCGAVAEPGSIAARAFSTPVSVAVHPDQARAWQLEIARKHLGEDPALLTDPAGNPVDEPRTDVDAGVLASQQAARRAEADVDFTRQEVLEGVGHGVEIDEDEAREARAKRKQEQASKLPRTHDELDELAAEHGVEFSDDETTVEAKQNRLRAEGVTASDQE